MDMSTAFEGRDKGSIVTTSVPIPKFASACRSSDANFGIKGTLATLWFQCGFGFEVPTRAGRDTLGNFKSTALGSHIGIIRPAAPFGGNPSDVLIRILDVAGFAVDAILRVDDKAGLRAFLQPFVDDGRTIARRWAAITVVLGRPLQVGIRHLQVHRLVLLVIGVGKEHRGETVEG